MAQRSFPRDFSSLSGGEKNSGARKSQESDLWRDTGKLALLL